MGFLRQKKQPAFKGSGLVIFADVHEALKAEQVLKEADYGVKLVAPPPALRKGCDLAIEMNLVEQFGIERLFREKDVAYVDILPLAASASQPLDIVKVTDFDDWVMVTAGNMKLTFNKETGAIVNTSGGGCPDIPYLHAQLVDRQLSEAPSPREIGYTLCALMLHRALEECRLLWQRGEQS
jgi:hypothetical protein